MRTQIVATIGPKCDSREAIQALIEEGMTIARMNFSHCTKEEFVARKALIEEIAKASGRKIYILQDLQGPRIRVGELPDQGVELRDKDLVTFSTSPVSLPQIFINHPTLHQDLKVGDPLFLSSGEMELQVEAIQGSLIQARVVRGGILYSRKGVNVPQTKLSTSGMTEKDKEDVAFALREGVDFIAISFVQSHEDVLRLRKLTGEKVKIVSKIETALALKDIDRIIQASDAIMVARGDLGVEMPIESIPFIQKNLIRHATWHGKGSITATQMLTSMINHPRPTRAEVSDIANAVWDGTDAVMLSDETASGNYPKEAVAAMARIVKQAEEFHLLKPNNLIGLE